MGVMHSLNKIADALQVPLACTSGVIGGGGVARLKLFGKTVVDLQLKPVAIFKSAQVGVVVHVREDLYLMVAHYEKTEALSAYIIDKAVLGTMYSKGCDLSSIVTEKMSARDAIGALGKSIKASFYRKDQGTGWKPLVLPK